MKTQTEKIRSLLLSILLAAATACGGGVTGMEEVASSDPSDNSDSGDDSNDNSGDDSVEEAIASFGTRDQYFYVPGFSDPLAPEQYPAMSTLQEMARGLVKMFNPELHFPIDWDDEENIPPLVAHEEVEEYMAENNHPNEFTCALPADPMGASVFSTGGVGTNPLPARDESWAGSATGGCGTWATAMCNRILGLTGSDSEVTRDEWNEIAGGIGQNATGGSSLTGQSEYYDSRGFCVNNKKFGGSAEDYAEMVEKIDDSCDIKLFFWKRNADGTYTNGHVETVTAADADAGSCTTNSWGSPATITGGDSGGFDHSLDGTQFQDAAGNELWPAGSTEVWVSYVCECGFFEGLAKSFFGM